MMDAGRHPNIELLTYSDVVGVEGFVGNYKAKILKRARYGQATAIQLHYSRQLPRYFAQVGFMLLTLFGE